MTLFKKLIGTFILLSILLAFGPKGKDPIERLVNSLQEWTDNNPQEKVYLHMDKPYYAIGDTIWFKGYLTTGPHHELSALSGALYVDFITEKDSLITTLKLPVNGGMAMGDLVISNDLAAGNYRIRAYTQWMRNAGADYFFDRTFTVGSLLADEVLARSTYQYVTADGKTSLIATLGYTDKEGHPLANKKVEYDVVLNKQRIYSNSAKTNDQGIITVDISNEKQLDLRGGYIRTKIKSPNVEGNNLIIRDFPIKAGFAKIDVQFFPESGNLVNGIMSKVAFKATGIDGKGIFIKGILMEDSSNNILEFTSLKFGMGSFTMIPKEGKAYSAKVVFPDGTEELFALPKALEEGYVLRVYQPNEDSVLVRVSVSPKTLAAAAAVQKPVDLSIIAQVSGQTIMATPLRITRVITSFWLGKDDFPSGIAQFTLFSEEGEPLNERIAFIKRKDHMNLTLNTSKRTYKSKESILRELEAKDRNDEPATGNFSVTVIDESKVPFEEELESTIFSNLLLTSDLKGYIERPNYYFSKETDTVQMALDNLMLTQGYRRFAWKEIAANLKTGTDPGKAYLTHAMFKPEGLGIDITGVVKSLGGQPAPGAKLTLMAMKAGIVQSATADGNGRFSFERLMFRDSIRFALQARTSKNGTKVEIVLDSIPGILVSKNRNSADLDTNIPATTRIYVENSRKQEEAYEKNGVLNRNRRLREVNISGRKSAVMTYASQGAMRVPEGSADQTYILKSTAFANLGMSLTGMLQGITFTKFEKPFHPIIENAPFYRDKTTKELVLMQVIVDGNLVREDDLDEVFQTNVLALEDVVKVDVVISNQAILSRLGGIPSILIYTRRGFQRKAFNPGMANISLKGFNKARVFYIPRYDSQASQTALPDYRSTIYWNANLKTMSSGKVSFDYFNADSPGRYKVIIEGISAEGELGRLVYKYSLDGG